MGNQKLTMMGGSSTEYDASLLDETAITLSLIKSTL